MECRHCGISIKMVSLYYGNPVPNNDRVKQVWVDQTGGDVCCADKFMERNENGRHLPCLI